MLDVVCPYCKKDQEINHDDGYGYEEDTEYEQYCYNCNKPFKFITSISFSYNVYCDNEHELENTIDGDSDFFECRNCDHYELRRD